MLHRRRPGRRQYRALDGCAAPRPATTCGGMPVGDGVLFYTPAAPCPCGGRRRRWRSDAQALSSAGWAQDSPTTAHQHPTKLYFVLLRTAEPSCAKTRLLGLAELRNHPNCLAALRVLQRGNRLSITPVEAAHWAQIVALLA